MTNNLFRTYIKKALLTIIVVVLVFVQTIQVDANVITEKSGSVEIIRLVGNSRYDTSIEIADALKRELKVSKFKNIILASGDGFPDALSGSYLALVKSAPILLISDATKSDIVNYVRNNLASGGRVYILGGDIAVPTSVEELLSGLKVKRLAGSNRFETNLKVLREAGALNSQEFMVGCANDYPDALAAAATGRPILLVDSNLKDAQKRFFGNSKNKNFYIVGGEKVVPKSIEGELSPFGRSKRIAGESRYETALEVAKAFFPETQEKVVLAYAHNFPDALSVGPLAIKMNAPVLLSSNNNLAYAYNYAVDHKTEEVFILGGKTLIASEGAGGSQKNGDEFNVDGYKYYVKSNSRLLQNETIEVEGIKIIADKGGRVTEVGQKGIKGIDVSAYQGTIDWAKVKKDGVEFAFIRVGGRFGASGKFYPDSYAKTNLRNATQNGIKVGVYFFTQAITTKEAIEEAKYTLDVIKGFDVTLPVVIDTEYLSGGRHNKLNAKQRTDVCQAFCRTVEAAGYKGMVYANVAWLNNNLQMSRLSQYDVWVAQYYHTCQYKGKYVCWQYTSKGHVDGIRGNVDMNTWVGGSL